MKSVTLSISTIERVKEFCSICAEQDFNIDVSSGRYTVDGKSILALFSLNLSKPVVCCYPEKGAEGFESRILAYICD